MSSLEMPTYVMSVREIRAALHPKMGGSGLQFVDSTSASVFLPLSPETLEQLTSDIRWVLLQLEIAGLTETG